MRSVQPGKTYRTFGYAGVHEIHQAEDLMEKAHREVTGRSRTYIETVAEVAPDYRSAGWPASGMPASTLITIRIAAPIRRSTNSAWRR